MNENKKSLMTPFLVLIILVVSFAAGSLFQKVKSLESGSNTAVSTNKLSVENLKKYAKDFKLDTKKFNNCLDTSEKRALVEKEAGDGSAFGVSGTPAFFLNGYFIGGAIPFEMFKTIIDYELKTGFGTSKTYPEDVKALVDQGIIVPEKKDVKVENSPSKGPQNAKITLIGYSDFECPYCAREAPVVDQVLNAYPNDIRFVFKQYPLPPAMHPSAQKAAEASLCALDQGKFWEYHDKLFGLTE